MKNLKNTLSIIILVFVLPNLVVAQQNDDYKFNYENMFLRNPAALTSFDYLGSSVYYLKQFSGIENAPQDMFASFQSPIPYQNISVGIAIGSDRAGLLYQNKINLSASYKLNSVLRSSDYLAIGTSFDITQFGIKGDKIEVVNGNDPLSVLGLERALGFNVGAGVFYSSARSINYRSKSKVFQAGLSALQAIPQKANFQNISYDENLYLNGVFLMIAPFGENSYWQPMLEVLYENSKLINLNLGARISFNNSFLVNYSFDMSNF